MKSGRACALLFQAKFLHITVPYVYLKHIKTLKQAYLRNERDKAQQGNLQES